MKLNRKYLIMLAGILFLTGRLHAEFPPIGYFSQSEGNPPIPFQTGDSLHVGVHSNDTIAIAGRPVFSRHVRTSSHLVRILNGAAPRFQIEPQVNIAPGFFPDKETTLESFQYKARRYGRIIDGHDGRYMTWIRLDGSRINIYQYPSGGERNDSLVARFADWWFGSVFIEGDLEIEGSFFHQAAIVASGDIHLRDDILYHRANQETGEFPDPGTESILTLIAGGDIIIDNTVVNGRDNGYGEFPGRLNRHSILLNGHFIALGGGLTFADRNYEGDDYDGPSPDERGRAFIKGALFQAERKELHNDNHGGTGYRLVMSTDSRLDEEYFYYIRNPWHVYLRDQESVTVDSNYLNYAGGLECREFTALPGARVVCYRPAMRVIGQFVISGTKDAPVIFTNPSARWDYASTIEIGGLRNSEVSIEHLIADSLFEITSDASIVRIANSNINGDLTINEVSEAFFDSNFIQGVSSFADPGRVRLLRNTFIGSVTITGDTSNCLIANNDFVDSRRTVLTLEGAWSCEVINNLFLHCDEAIYATRGADPQVHHNLFYDNRRGEGSGYSFGEGNLFADPLLVNWRRGNYYPSERSPCIDAGDPSSPRDPDGTRADIGAFWLDRGLEAGDPPFNSPPASRRGKATLTASPNPFNATTVIRFAAINRGKQTLGIYDLSGREVAGFSDPTVSPPRLTEKGEAADRGGSAVDGIFTWNASSFPAGFSDPTVSPPRLTEKGEAADRGGSAVDGIFTWNASSFPAGIYFVQYANGAETHSIKLVKVD